MRKQSNKIGVNDSIVNEDNDNKKLRKIMDQMDINTNNFIILISEVVNYYLKKDIPESRVFNKSIDTLILFLGDIKNITTEERLHLETQIPNRINSILNLRKKQINELINQNNKTKSIQKNKSRSSLGGLDISEMDVDSIIDYVYNKIVKMITIKDLGVLDFANHLFDITESTIKIINEFSQLNSLEKKRVIIKIFNMIVENADEIFVNLSPQDIEKLKLSNLEVPDIIEVIILMINSVDIPPKVSGCLTNFIRLLFCMPRGN